ncbi:hypothetical protein AAMO2058_001500800 [Amorphochlora amoebiformis]
MASGRKKRRGYAIIENVGEGTFGQVYRARDEKTGEVVALKRVRIGNIQNGISLSLFREIKALQHIKSLHVIKLHKYFAQGSSVVLVLEYMSTDLRHIMQSMQEKGHCFADLQIKSLLHMTLKGIHAVHQMRLLHRDIKPSNLLLAQNGLLKLADFGLARILDGKGDYTHEVATRWYRAPELLFGSRSYGRGVDIWALGCVFGELMNHMPLFPGQNDIDQLSTIFSCLGTPSTNDWPSIKDLPDYAKISFPEMKRKPLEEVVPRGTKAALRLLDQLLAYNPSKRSSALAALDDSYFEAPPPNRMSSKPSIFLSIYLLDCLPPLDLP